MLLLVQIEAPVNESHKASEVREELQLVKRFEESQLTQFDSAAGEWFHTRSFKGLNYEVRTNSDSSVLYVLFGLK